MRSNLDTNPHVVMIAEELGLEETHVVGLLHKLWSWADQQTIDGNAVKVTEAFLERYMCVTGFTHALRKVGWLDGKDGDLTFKNFSEHNGQTAKKRSQTAKRVEKHRSNAPSVTKALPEKRREEKRREDSLSERGEGGEREIDFALAALDIVEKYPKTMGRRVAADHVAQQLESSPQPQEMIDSMTKSVASFAAVIKKHNASRNRYVTSCEKFFVNSKWEEDPAELDEMLSPKSNQSNQSDQTHGEKGTFS